MRTLAAIALLLLPLAQARAHGIGEPAARALWTFDPWIVTPLALVGALYGIGAFVLYRRGRRQPGWRLLLFCGGWLTLAGSLISPLHWLGEHLLAFHMIEHEIIMAISAPLLVLANPIGALLWSLPRRGRATVGRAMRWRAVVAGWRWLSDGSPATAIHGLAIWAWHAPVTFDAAVGHLAVHRLQHLSFFLTALLFWWSVFRRCNAGQAAWNVVVTMLHTGVLGALMALAPRALYATQPAFAATWGLTPLEDQQLAGLIMWVPAGTIYAGAALMLAAIWIRRTGDQARRDDAAATI